MEENVPEIEVLVPDTPPEIQAMYGVQQAEDSDDEIVPATPEPIPAIPVVSVSPLVLQHVHIPAMNWTSTVERSLSEFVASADEQTMEELSTQLYSSQPALPEELVDSCNKNPAIMSAVMSATEISIEKAGFKETVVQSQNKRKVKASKNERQCNLIVEIIRDVKALGPYASNSPLAKIEFKLQRLYNKHQDKLSKQVTLVHLSFFSAEYRLGRQVALTTIRVWITYCTLPAVLELNKRCFYVPSCLKMTTSVLTCQVTLHENGTSKTVHVGEFLLLQTKGISKENVAALLNIAATTLHYSHLCHLAICCNPAHGVIEPFWKNHSRKPCSRMSKCVCNQEPSCFLPCHPQDTEQVMMDELGFMRKKRGRSARPDFEEK